VHPMLYCSSYSLREASMMRGLRIATMVIFLVGMATTGYGETGAMPPAR